MKSFRDSLLSFGVLFVVAQHFAASIRSGIPSEALAAVAAACVAVMALLSV